MSEICLWCGAVYEEGMDGCCRKCWEENQFAEEESDSQDAEGGAEK